MRERGAVRGRVSVGVAAASFACAVGVIVFSSCSTPKPDVAPPKVAPEPAAPTAQPEKAPEPVAFAPKPEPKPEPAPAPEPEPAPEPKDEWISLFDGKTLDGWRASENKGTFTVRDGEIVVRGKRSHLFYEGPVEGHDFTNFEFKADVLTKKGANAGLYFHTEYQERGWPSKGYEVQVNNTHKDWRKTAGLYGIKDVRKSPAEDDVWFTEQIIVRGKRIITMVNGEVIVDYTEPEDAKRSGGFKGRLLSSGTFAIQGHDPGSEAHFKNIHVKVLPD